MKKIIFFIILTALASLTVETNVYSQDTKEDLSDTLITGGIYRFVLNSGKHFTGELISRGDSTIEILIENEIRSYDKSKIKSISIAKINSDLEDAEPLSMISGEKFRFLSSVQTGINIPTGSFSDDFGPGIGFQMSIYHLFSSVFGIGTEFQYNTFSGNDLSQKYPYSTSSTMISNEGFNSFFIKINAIFGNLNPKKKLVLYGLFGIGAEHYYGSDRTETSTYYDPYYNQNYTYQGTYATSSGETFIYSAGIGAFYKFNQKLGINCEIQYDLLPTQDNFRHYNAEDDDIAKFVSIKVGIMYTKF